MVVIKCVVDPEIVQDVRETGWWSIPDLGAPPDCPHSAESRPPPVGRLPPGILRGSGLNGAEGFVLEGGPSSHKDVAPRDGIKTAVHEELASRGGVKR